MAARPQRGRGERLRGQKGLGALVPAISMFWLSSLSSLTGLLVLGYDKVPSISITQFSTVYFVISVTCRDGGEG